MASAQETMHTKLLATLVRVMSDWLRLVGYLMRGAVMLILYAINELTDMAVRCVRTLAFFKTV